MCNGPSDIKCAVHVGTATPIMFLNFALWQCNYNPFHIMFLEAPFLPKLGVPLIFVSFLMKNGNLWV